MPRRSAPRKYAQRSVIYLTFFLLLSIPLVLYGIAQESLDIRNRAFEDLELSEDHPCLISLPNVNPYSLEVGKTVTIQIDAMLTDDSISEVTIFDSLKELVYQETFENAPIEIATSFQYTPKISGVIDMTGVIKKGQGGSVECEISSPYDIKGLRAIPNNTAPEFTTSPSQSKPSQSIKTGDLYEYTLIATDVDKDRVNYSYSFTPRADWLQPIIIEDGSTGRLTIKFRGSTEKPASYLANVFIHDGYSQHLLSQSWVISVSPKENDIPIVRIIDPVESLKIDQGKSFKTAWEAIDWNHIVRYELYITNNPAYESEWKAIDKNIAYNVNSYDVNTSDLTPGTYKVITKAIDNQQPSAVGMGVSPEIVVSKSTEDIPSTQPDDSVILKQPQVTNMSPSSTEEISNRRVTIRATLVASEDADVNEKSIIFKLDDQDISKLMKINKISSKEYTVIYQPEEDLKEGVHKAEVAFSDSKELEISKTWNFTIKGTDSKSDETYNIFGYEVSRTMILIVGVGLLTVILALVAPFVIFSIWKDEKKDSEMYGQQNQKLPPSTPSDNTPYILKEENISLRGKVEGEGKEKEKKGDVWDQYSAAKPPLTEEQKAEYLEDDIEEKEVTTNISSKSATVEDIPTTTTQINAPPSPPPVDIPDIPEPEIPEAGDLEKIFQQIQQTQQAESSHEQSVVKE